MKHGFAIFTYDDGRVFKGFFNEDKMIPNSSTDTSAKRVVIHTDIPSTSPVRSPGKSKNRTSKSPVDSTTKVTSARKKNGIESILKASIKPPAPSHM